MPTALQEWKAKVAAQVKVVATLQAKLAAAQKTLAALRAAKPKPAPTLVERLMPIVRKELGTAEWPAGSNRGPIVKYLASVGLSGGYPWCAAFVTWCLHKADYKGPWPPNRAYCPSWEVMLRKNGLVKAKVNARRGDIVLFDWQGDGVSDHIGFITASYGPIKVIHTIEGNTGDKGAVLRRVRPWWQVRIVARLHD